MGLCCSRQVAGPLWGSVSFSHEDWIYVCVLRPVPGEVRMQSANICGASWRGRWMALRPPRCCDWAIQEVQTGSGGLGAGCGCRGRVGRWGGCGGHSQVAFPGLTAGPAPPPGERPSGCPLYPHPSDTHRRGFFTRLMSPKDRPKPNVGVHLSWGSRVAA